MITVPYPHVHPDRGDAWEHPADRLLGANGQPQAAVGLPIVSCGQLVRTYPDLRPPLIDGLLRRGETMNVIAAPKIGKSWLSLSLAFAVAMGRPWLGFGTTCGNVLIIDNELHAETIAHRLRKMAHAIGVEFGAVAEAISILPLRGRLQNLSQLGPGLLKIGPGKFALILLDAFYRAVPAETNENDNATMANLYNSLDCYADALAAGIVLVHHASKGDQSLKSITDVGAGAGAQSRATDTHLILRPHEEPGVVVLDAAVRSWAPVDPRCLRWEYPLWYAAPDCDPALLRGAKRPRSRATSEVSITPEPEPAWTSRRFAEQFGKPEPRPEAQLLDDARGAGVSDRKAHELLKAAIDLDLLHRWPDPERRNRKFIASVRPPQPEPEPTPAPPEPAQESEASKPPKRPRKGKKRARPRARTLPPTPPQC